MADTVSTDVIVSGGNKYIARFIGISDGTGESDVAKIDISTLTGPDGVNAPSSIVIEKITYSIQGHARVLLEWDGTADRTLAVLAAGEGVLDWTKVGGLKSAATGGTNDVLLTSSATAAATYDITIEGRLKA